MDYRRPIDAELILENQIELTFSLLEERGISMQEIAIGFVDETRPQNTANTVRVWSFEKAACRIFCNFGRPVIPNLNQLPWINTF